MKACVLVAVMAVLASCSSSNTGAPVCAPLSQVCPPDGGPTSACNTDWANAAAWCATLSGGPFRALYFSHCGGFNVVTVAPGPDVVVFYYYDPQSGALVGIQSNSTSGSACFGQVPNADVACSDEGGPPSVSCESDGAVAE
jgi:hypothetical protein